ncbi:helix-turn-helix domain-containing protein [Streptomyces kaniharaensis]|uniref:Helix-turn-helix domain-containing protein n=1 Tax=Streptomyces kaniharaensis TaxID=212423 RepID=A0A6N7L4G4_9ACTN|nr:helix-turn-helix transcriptional regulator [Streptomyces kaniharaensis]MQS17518.1 helix-turn-helix domain-containing protein [Streptomyces kaniharaensis]
MATSDPTYRRARFGSVLRRLREQCQLTQGAAAAQAGVGVDKINRVELGRVALGVPLLRTLLDLYGVQDSDRRNAMEDMVVNLAKKSWWNTYSLHLPLQDFLGLEQDAEAAWAWEPLLVHGRLQTERYAEALLASGDEVIPGGQDRVESMVAVRMHRQDVVTSALTVVLGAAALDTVVGGPDVMREQIAHLLTRKEVELRILPVGRPHVGLDGAFTILSFPDGGQLAAVESLVTTSYFDDPESLSLYGRAAKQLTDLALDPSASRAYLEERVRAL